MSITLKIEFPHLNGAVKMMRFSTDIPIQQIVKEIKEKLDFSGIDHALYVPPIEGRTKVGQWLKENHTLMFYNLSGDVRTLYARETEKNALFLFVRK